MSDLIEYVDEDAVKAPTLSRYTGRMDALGSRYSIDIISFQGNPGSKQIQKVIRALQLYEKFALEDEAEARSISDKDG